jgi:tetratricopeptide (TPR) repeat protein
VCGQTKGEYASGRHGGAGSGDNRVMTRQLTVLSLAGAALLLAATTFAQPPAAAAAPQGPGADLLAQGQQKLRDGKHDEALALFRDAAAKAPDAAAPRVQAGVVLDLQGKYAEARTEFSRAIELAKAPDEKARAQRAMAMSYAFQRNCAGAAQYEAPLYDGYVTAKDFFNAGEIANELARVCLESGSLDEAATWYRKGHDAGVQEPNLTAARKDLWEFRQEHALARLAARRGRASEAQAHVSAARAILDKGTNPEQAPFLPYLVGYVAFYGGDYKTALAELQKGNQNDPFILVLMAQSQEKLGNQAAAVELYKKVLASNAHNPTGAFSRPLAKQKVGG